MRMLGAVAGTIAAALALCFGMLLAGMRWKLGPVLDVVRRFNKTATNPRVLRTAGSARSQTSLIRHAGRSTGRTYETPVDAMRTATGFLIALPYGTRSDWLRNVLAAGSATVVTRGERVDVDAPAGIVKLLISRRCLEDWSLWRLWWRRRTRGIGFRSRSSGMRCGCITVSR